MRAKTGLILAFLMIALGAIMACCSGIMAGSYQIKEIPAIGTIVILLGIMLFIAGLVVVIELVIFGGEE